MRTTAFRLAGLAFGAAFALAAAPLVAQPAGFREPAFTLTLPNYYMTPIGQVGGLEGGAFVARTNDASSNWYNPAGLALANKSSISSSAGSYQLLNLVPRDLQKEDSGGSAQQVPALVGVVVKKMFGNECLTGGFAAVRTNSWEQQTSAQIDETSTIPGRLVSYSSDSQFRRTEVSVGLGYADGGPWRFGGTLAASNTALSAVGSVGKQFLEPDGLDNFLVDRRVSGSISQLRLTAGAQYQATPEILVGALVRSPGLTLFRSGDSSANAEFNEGGASGTLAFFDPDVRFDYKLPLQISAGAALVKERFQLELDVNFMTGTSAYDLFSSTRSATVILDNGQGGPPVVEHVPYGDIVTQNRAIVNFALGGSYTLTKNNVWVLHFGFNTDISPVGDADKFFSNVDLYGGTLGVSGQVGGFIAAIGFNYMFGNANDAPVAELLDSDINIDSIAILYSVAYRF